MFQAESFPHDPVKFHGQSYASQAILSRPVYIASANRFFRCDFKTTIFLNAQNKL